MQEFRQIWRPNVVFTNAKIGEMKADPFGLMVKKESRPEPFSYASPVEGNIMSFATKQIKKL